MIINNIFKIIHSMKNIYILVMVAILSSCSTMEKFQVSGTPNTEIYTPDLKHVGTINAAGKANIKLTSDAYYAFLFSKAPGAENYIPFALDYNRKKRTGLKLQEGLGYTLAIPGCITAIAGTILLAVDSESSAAGPVLGAGLGLTLAGVAIGAPASSKLSQTAYYHQFKYIESQQVNDDINLSTPVFKEPGKEDGQEDKRLEKTIESAQSVEELSSVSRKTIGEKSSKTLKDNGKSIAGVYIGTGSLTQGEENIEIYKDIKVELKRVNKNEVDVNVIESDGNKIFDTASGYKIEKNGENAYTLTHQTIKDAKIDISSDGKLTYIHSKVNIEGSIYVLKISANIVR